jgi:hypothetical protein
MTGKLLEFLYTYFTFILEHSFWSIPDTEILDKDSISVLNPEGEGDMILQNVGIHSRSDMVSCSRRPVSSTTLL